MGNHFEFSSSCPSLQPMSKVCLPPLALWSCVSLALCLVGCSSAKKEKAAEGEKPKTDQAAAPSAEGSLLNMTYEEAKAISPQKLEIPPFYKVAADEIEVVRKNKDGSPRAVRAKGKVFLYIDFLEPAVALCQEAYFGESEVILRGNPLLKRGGSVIEGLSKSTVFYMLGLRLRVIGRHRVQNEAQVSPDLPDFMYPDGGGGPNPLLPPLSPDSVPSKVRDQMLRAAESEALLQRLRVEPVLPLREDAMPQNLAPLLVPEVAPAPATSEPKTDSKTQPMTEKAPDKAPEKVEEKPAAPTETSAKPATGEPAKKQP